MKSLPRLSLLLFATIDLLAQSAPASRRFDLHAEQPYSDERGSGFDLGTVPHPQGNPFYFSVAVPEGNWRVTLSLRSGTTPTALTVKAESRRLMLESVPAAPDATVEKSFLVNVRTPALPPPEKNAPGGTAVLLNDRETDSFTWDGKLTLELHGVSAATLAQPGGCVITLEPVDAPTVFLVGDSTVTDQRWEDGASWGQMLPRFLDDGVAVANHAESGETMKSFLSGLRLAKVLSQLKAGDYLFIQFGHNDQKKQWPQTYVEAATTYRAYLCAYVAEARLRGATPVLVTSPQRRTFDEQGRIRNSHGDYPATVRAVAAEEGVALIDVEAASRSLYEALGPTRAPLAFSNEGKDATHHNNYGAYQLARAVAQGIRDARLPLASHLVPEITAPASPAPAPPETFRLPVSPARSTLRPRGS